MDSRVFPKQKPILLDSKSDLFSDPPLVFNYSQRIDLAIKPRVHNELYAEYEVPVSTTLFTSPELLLYMRFQLVDADGKDIPAAKLVALCNAFPNAVVADLIVRVGDQIICGYTANYAQMATFLMTFGHSKDNLENTQQELMFYKKSAGNVMDLFAATEPGWKYRESMCNASRKIESIVRLLHPLAFQRKLLVPGLRLNVEVRWAPASRVLETRDSATFTPKLKILECDLLVSRYSLQPELTSAIFHKYATTGVVNYSYRGFKMFGPISIARGVTSIDQEVINGVRPDAMVIFFIESDRDRGEYNLNCLMQSPLDVISAQASFNSTDRAPTSPYLVEMIPPDESTFQVVLKYLYYQLLRFQGALGYKVQSIVNFEDFKTGYFCIPFLFQAHGLSNAVVTVPTDVGSTRVKIDLRSPTLKVQHMYCLAVVSELLTIDEHRSVIQSKLQAQGS